jgi:hypothetical protein
VGVEMATLKCAAWNIGRGFFAKEAEITNIAKNHDLDIFTIIEADIVYQSDPPTIEGYKAVPTLRSDPLQKVRVLTLVKETLFSRVKVRTDLMSENFASVWLQINGLLMCQFYREWTKHQDEKLDIFLSQIHSANSSKKSFIVMGDCNLDQEKWDKPSYAHFKLSEQLRTGLAQSGLEILPMGLTYTANHRSINGDIATSALDHIYCSTKKPVRTRTLQSTASDHLPIMAEIDLDTKNPRKVTTVTKRCFKSFNSESFQRDLLLQDLPAALARCGDVDELVTTLESQINQVLDYHAPHKEVKIRPSFKKGLSDEAKDLMKERNRLQRKMKTLDGDQKFQMHLQYRQLRNKCVSLQKRDTIKNNVNQFNDLTNPKDIWRATKSVINPRTKTEHQLKVGNDLIQDDYTVAKVFNDFFVSKVEGLRNSIDAKGLPDPLSEAKSGSNTPFVLKTVTEGQVVKAIEKLKNKSSTGLDDINSMVLKAGGEVLAYPLCYIINTSITSGRFPGRWKEAKLIPIHKKGNTQEVNNYRPVSNLCVISKVLEMVVHDQITRHCDKENLIPKSQHGFQVGKSTLTATISMFDQWQQAMEKEQSTGVLIFDLSAAFDTLDHKILARKLTSLNFSDQSLMWINSFLERRVQQVQVGRTLSSARHIGVGVPQGSVLSPLLFLLYISDIENWIQAASVHGYADDTTMTMSSQDMSSLLEGLEAEAARMLQYMAVNKLVANPKKTKFLLIRGKKHKKWPVTGINIGNDLVKESTSEKILGVTVNNKLNWDEQHINIVNTLRYKVSMLRRLAFHLPGWVLVKILDGLVFSSVRYCLPLWGSTRLTEQDTARKLSKSIQVEINNALRCALGLSREDHVTVIDLHEKTKSLTFNQLVIQATNRLTVNIFNGDCKGLENFYDKNEEPKRTTRFTEKGDMIPPSMRNVPYQGFRVQSIKLWNSLGNDRKISKLSLINDYQ